jgi:hypothetical protein
MSLSVDMDPKRKRVITYVVLGVIFLGLLGVAIGVFRHAKASASADQKAGQLQAAFSDAGLPVPDKEQITRVLGSDGGGMCDDPTDALRKAQLQAQMSTGAGGPGARPIISDEQVVQGEVLAIGIYCPDKLAEFTTYINDNLKFDDVINQ